MADPIVFEGLATRIASLRKSRGLDVASLASLLGVSVEWVYDIESYDDEVQATLTIRQLLSLCAALCVSPVTLLAPNAILVERTDWIHLSELSEVVARLAESSPAGLDAFEDEAGWFVGHFVQEPGSIDDWCFDRLLDICSAAGVDWTRVVPALETDLR
jgi:transcriptional regulator with XRE-family HTH domain